MINSPHTPSSVWASFGDAPLFIWMAVFFLLGVAACAASIWWYTKNRGANIWGVFGLMVLIGLATLFMMFFLPELVFHWDFCFQRSNCGA